MKDTINKKEVMKCSWVNCTNEAKHKQISKDGQVWAILCEEHEAKIVKDIKEKNIKAIVANWVKACGGAKKMSMT